MVERLSAVKRRISFIVCLSRRHRWARGWLRRSSEHLANKRRLCIEPKPRRWSFRSSQERKRVGQLLKAHPLFAVQTGMPGVAIWTADRLLADVTCRRHIHGTSGRLRCPGARDPPLSSLIGGQHPSGGQ